ncbi:hypothetical protein H072_9160 [Dactylellina haptotyla CBS 200.50]|uniref:DUF7029 domain-containing protein n=1 Tax=Dactylellina haptotyla (strain CBS 200.50) TaxID=1284197 RepID=S8A380_DACHA|nr:hypothetical protein H072_9160 [Dactylellina haptotyla CBS 200.50]
MLYKARSADDIAYVIAFSLQVFASGSKTLVPSIHWETDTADYAHLLPKSHVTVFYSDIETDSNGNFQVAHLWAEYFTDVVALEHSDYVETVHCGDPDAGGIADMTITFSNDNAYQLAKKEWSPYSELLFIGANFTHAACFPDVHQDSNRFWVMSQIAFPPAHDQGGGSSPQQHVTFRSLPIRFQDAIKDVDIKLGKQQKPLVGTPRVYKRYHPLSPTNQKGPQLLPRAEGDVKTSQEDDIPTTEEITISSEMLAQGPDGQLSNVTSEFVVQDLDAFSQNGFGAFPGADSNSSLLAPDVITSSQEFSVTYAPSTIAPTDTGRVDEGVPTPTTAPDNFIQNDGPVMLASYNLSDPFVLVETSNGNLVRRDNATALGNAETKLFIVQSGLVVSDDSGRMFNLYQDEIQNFNVSRIRLHAQDLVPKTALFVTWVPVRVDGLKQGVLAISTTNSVYFAPVICDIQGQDSKVFAVPFDSLDHINVGLSFLQSSAAKTVITGGDVTNCYTILLTDGNGGLTPESS